MSNPQNNQQQNRQQNNPQPPITPASNGEAPKPQQAQEITRTRAYDEAEKQERKFPDTRTTFRELVDGLVIKLVRDEITVQEARKLMHNWYQMQSVSAKDYLSRTTDGRNDTDAIINRIKGIVDTISQEIPYLWT